MDVYLVRHGIAVNVGEQGVNRDFDRMLSEEGRLRTRQVAGGLARLDVAPDVILTSPLVRALQTAEILSEALPGKPEVEVFELLQGGGSPAEMVRALALRDEASVMMVGHMPDLSELASAVLAAPGQVYIPFKKAAVCALNFHGKVALGRGTLQWHAPPRHLRFLAPS